MRVATILILSFLLSAVCSADCIKLPRKSYTIDKWEEAKAEAKSKGSPITFLYTDKKSSCSLCINASTSAIKALKTSTIFVYIGRTEKGKAPDLIRNTLNKKGKFIPKVVVSDSEVEEVLGSLIYEEIKGEGRKAFRPLKKAIREYRKSTSGNQN